MAKPEYCSQCDGRRQEKAQVERPDLEGILDAHCYHVPDRVGVQLCQGCKRTWPCNAFVVTTYALQLEQDAAGLRQALTRWVNARDRCEQLRDEEAARDVLTAAGVEIRASFEEVDAIVRALLAAAS